MIIDVESHQEIDFWREELDRNTRIGVEALRGLTDPPLKALAQIKFAPIGRHPLEDRPLNMIEQVNQTFTYWVALRAAELLLDWHPEISGLRLAPGAHAPKGSLDIESHEKGVVGAETFAAPPKSNQKLKGDLDKLAARKEQHRYVFFTAPAFNATRRRPEMERDGTKVWSLELTT